jgi:hypothetical protein
MAEKMGQSSVSELYKQFEEGCKNTEDDEKCGHPRFHRNDENFGIDGPMTTA